MFRRWLCVLLAFLPLTAFALTGPGGETIPDSPPWQGKIRMVTRLRKVKDMNSRDWLGKVPEDALLDVYAVEGDWCICGYAGEIGYIPYDRMYQFYRLTDEALPAASVVDGIAVLTRDALLMVDGYTGNQLPAGTALCSRRSGLVPMMQTHVQLPADSFTFTPFVPAADAKPGDALYGYTTFFNDSMAGRYPANRADNIALAVDRLQGVVLLPGEKFSFNALCGPYTADNGYKRAKNVSDDGYGYGGGVCQVSTTIFNAVQGVRIRLDEWYIHSYWGVKYVPRTMDAAVSSVRDFSFYNEEDFPLVMECSVQDGVLTVILRRGE